MPFANTTSRTDAIPLELALDALEKILGPTDAKSYFDERIASITQGDRDFDTESPWDLSVVPRYFGFLRRYPSSGENTASSAMKGRVEATRKHELVMMLPLAFPGLVELAESHEPLARGAPDRETLVQMAKDVTQLLQIYSVYCTPRMSHNFNSHRFDA